MERKSDFSEWYSEILKRAEILDVRYPVKGAYVWFPHGYKLRNLIYGILRSLLDEEHEEVLFPLLIPEDELLKEKEHIKGFEEEVFWVTKGGSTELEVPLALRPTSETAIYPVFKVWIRSHRDLPLRIYQIVNTFRYETKHTRPLIRLREITSFKEAHTVHASRAEAEEQVKKAVTLYKEFFDRLAVPYLVTRRPEWDKFPGADYTLAFDTLLPDGRALQVATIHLLGESFARTFEIKFEDRDGSLKFVNQTCYGISERCVAAVISVHGDERGLVLPPEVAPVQVVVVPILYSRGRSGAEGGAEGSAEGGAEAEEVLQAGVGVVKELKEAGVRVLLDDSDERPGAKYFKWELKGVPLRVEVGPRDLRAKSCELVCRHDFSRTQVPLAEVVSEVKRALSEIQDQIHERAKTAFRGFSSVFLCRSERCGREVEERLGVSVLGEAVAENREGGERGAVAEGKSGESGEGGEREEGGREGKGGSEGKCVICARGGKRVYIARSY